ncbi:hypothetical protein [Pasteurella sp. PK-2025]|uniref:hypothetical protein n=1 Tax=Pasteurella sp. PK-2025 TaxID=3413133 RepID=UPI003C765BAE
MRFLYCLFTLFLIGGCMPESYPLNGFSEEQKVLVKAIKAADVDKVRELAAKTDLDLVSEKSVPLLTAAIYEAMGDLKSDKPTKRLQIITELVRAGANVKRGGIFDSPLDIALAQEHPALLEAMLAGGLEPNYMVDGGPIIFDVLSNYKLGSVKALIKYGANIDLKTRATGGLTAAQTAIVVAPKVSYYLVTMGASIYESDDFTGKTFAMSVFRMEKSLKEDVDDVRSGRYKGNLEVIEGNLDAVQKIKAIMIEKGIEWPPKQ